MNKFFFTTAIALLMFLSTMAQVKKVALLDPVGSAGNHIKSIVYNEVYSIASTYGDISIIDKQEVNKIIEANNFQIDLLTEDSKISEICKAMKARYAFLITVSDVGKNNFSISCKIIDVITAHTVRLNFTQTRNGLADLESHTQQLMRDILDSMEIVFKQDDNNQIMIDAPVVKEDLQKDMKQEDTAAEAQAQKEKELAEVQARKDKELAEAKAREERELAEAKAREERKLAEAKAREERERAEAKALKEKLKAEEEKKIMQQKAKLFLDQLPKTLEFNELGGKETFYNHYYETSWNEWDITSWCLLQKTANSFIITCEPNPNTIPREVSFDVQAGDQFKKIWVKQKPKIFLTLSDTIIEFLSSGGKGTLAVLTNAPSWSVSKEITWCPMTKSDSSLTLACAFNPYLQGRSEIINIMAGNESKTVHIKQQKLTYLEKGSWKQALNKVMYNGATTYENGLYKGEKSNRGSRTGLGAYLFISDNESYWGDFLQGESSGKGIYIIGKEGNSYFSGCWGCKYYVGNWSSDMKNGLGKCYDSKGDMLYFGYYHNDKPIESFPQNCDNDYKFECIEYDNGDIYLGETHKGIKEGHGILFGANGDAWYGEWKDDIRNGNGIEYLRNGSIKTGRWTGDTH